MGIGNFFGSMPAPMQRSKLYGVELDSISGRIAKQLYQNANISITGFENTKAKQRTKRKRGMLSSDEEHDCIAAEKKENKQLKRIMEFADNNNLIPMKVFRRGIFGRRLRDEVFYKAIRYMRAGKADALIVTNLDAISDGIADSYLKIGAVREAGFRLFSVDEKEPKVDLYIPPKRGDL